jgi:hypothetical protein
VWQHGRTGSVGFVPEDNLALTCASHTRFVCAASLQAGDTAMAAAISKILHLLRCCVSWPPRRSSSQLLRIEKVPHLPILPRANLACTRSSAEVNAK